MKFAVAIFKLVGKSISLVLADCSSMVGIDLITVSALSIKNSRPPT